jgi:hypothetical protein
VIVGAGALAGMKIEKKKMAYFLFFFFSFQKNKIEKRIIGSTYP